LSVDPLNILGRLLEEFIEVEPIGQDPFVLENWQTNKRHVEEVLAKYGLRYRTGGRIVEIATGPPGKALETALQKRQLDSVEVEFERAVEMIARDPASAVTAACSLLEALLRGYLEAKQIPLPDKQSIKPLWAVVQKDLGWDPKDQSDQDVQRVLGGLTSIVDGIGAFRTHAGSAHGGGQYRYRVQVRHARLVVNAAHTLASFLIETWEFKEP
jgi:hypothetical protein